MIGDVVTYGMESRCALGWWKTQIINIYKGSRLECSNNRGISLLSVVRKVYARVLNDRVKLMIAESE